MEDDTKTVTTTQATASTTTVPAKKHTYVPPKKRVGTMAYWLMTPFGVLMPALRPTHHIPPGDTRTIQVRARRRETLNRFRELYCPELGRNVHFPKQDYQWKAYVTPEALAMAVGKMTLDIDSEVFKPLAEGPLGLKNQKLAKGLHDMYTSLWSTQLHYGDGTSSYDKWTASTVIGPRIGIGACRRWGHVWPKGQEKCSDCNEPNPNYPEAGPADSYPEGYPKPVPSGVASGVEKCRIWGHWWAKNAKTCQDCTAPNPVYPERYNGEKVYPEGWPQPVPFGPAYWVTTPNWESKYPVRASIENCREMGHWWPQGRETCFDCGEPNPNYPDAGPTGVYPAGYPKDTPYTSIQEPAQHSGTERCEWCGEDIEMDHGEWYAPGVDSGVCPDSASGHHEPAEYPEDDCSECGAHIVLLDGVWYAAEVVASDSDVCMNSGSGKHEPAQYIEPDLDDQDDWKDEARAAAARVDNQAFPDRVYGAVQSKSDFAGRPESTFRPAVYGEAGAWQPGHGYYSQPWHWDGVKNTNSTYGPLSGHPRSQCSAETCGSDPLPGDSPWSYHRQEGKPNHARYTCSSERCYTPPVAPAGTGSGSRPHN